MRTATINTVAFAFVNIDASDLVIGQLKASRAQAFVGTDGVPAFMRAFIQRVAALIHINTGLGERRQFVARRTRAVKRANCIDAIGRKGTRIVCGTLVNVQATEVIARKREAYWASALVRTWHIDAFVAAVVDGIPTFVNVNACVLVRGQLIASLTGARVRAQ